MSVQLTLDILARVASKSLVSYWRPLGMNEQASSQSFGTQRQWVEVAGPSFEATLASQHTASTLLMRHSAFVPAKSPGGDVDGVLSLGTPPSVWDRVRADPEPASPSHVSPSYGVTPSPIELTLRTVVNGVNHDLVLRFKVVIYSQGNPPPATDPIIIADIPEPLPQPTE